MKQNTQNRMLYQTSTKTEYSIKQYKKKILFQNSTKTKTNITKQTKKYQNTLPDHFKNKQNILCIKKAIQPWNVLAKHYNKSLHAQNDN